MITYDPKIIQEFADRLYAKAKSIVRNYSIVGILLLGFGGLASQNPIIALIGAILGGLIGYAIGTEKAFQYRLQAQTALCQVEIESNSQKQ